MGLSLLTQFGINAIATPSVFSPVDISGIKFWGDPSNSANYTIATGVSSLHDLSGNNNNATQGSASLQPTISSGGINGVDATQWDSDRLVLPTGQYSAASSTTIVMVIKMTNTVTALRQFYNSGTATNVICEGSPTDRVRGRVNPPTGTVQNTSSLLNQSFIFTYIVTAGVNAELFINGVTQGTAGLSETLTTGSTAPVLGNHPTANSAWNGLMGESCVYDRAISTQERQELESYLSNKWGV